MNKKVVICIIALIVIILGVVMANVVGFNRNLEFGNYTRIVVYMTEDANLEDIKAIVEETYRGEFEIAFTDEFKDTVSIKSKSVSDEELDALKEKINEKYSFESDSNNIVTMNVPQIGIYELIKDYLKPVIISLVIILIYFAIAFRKLGIVKSLIEPALTIITVGALYISIIVICRIPLNEYIIPLGILIYIISTLAVAICLNGKKQLIE